MATHKRKKRLRKNRHKKKKQVALVCVSTINKAKSRYCGFWLYLLSNKTDSQESNSNPYKRRVSKVGCTTFQRTLQRTRPHENRLLHSSHTPRHLKEHQARGRGSHNNLAYRRRPLDNALCLSTRSKSNNNKVRSPPFRPCRPPKVDRSSAVTNGQSQSGTHDI